MKNRIRFARGTSAEISTLKTTTNPNVPAGVPVFDTSNNYLYVSKGGAANNNLVKISAGHADTATDATNASITDLNSSDNAIVNFKIGNGTAYSKTVNNVAVAQRADNLNYTATTSSVTLPLNNGTTAKTITFTF